MCPLARVPLVDLRPREFHDLGPLPDVLLHEFPELCGRHAHRNCALLGPGFLYVWRVGDFLDLGIQTVDDQFRGRGRGHHPQPDHRVVTGKPASSRVGTRGVIEERAFPEVAIARTLPACASGAIVVIASNIICTSPARTLVRASALPLCGTCTTSIPAIALNSSPAMW